MMSVLALAFAGFAAAQDAPETSFDGLVKQEKGRFKLTYVDPDIDFSVYNKYIPGTAQFQFRAVKKTSSMTARRSNQREFWISDADKQKLEDTVSSIFAEELAKSETFTETNEPGPDTLIIRGALHDIVSQVPPEIIGRGEIYLSSMGEATLIIEAVDSLSGEVIYRAIERRAAARPGNQLVVANTVTSWAELRRLARRWASNLRDGMDSIHE
jgi:hypothetical protein